MGRRGEGLKIVGEFAQAFNVGSLSEENVNVVQKVESVFDVGEGGAVERRTIGFWCWMRRRRTSRRTRRSRF